MYLTCLLIYQFKSMGNKKSKSTNEKIKSKSTDEKIKSKSTDEKIKSIDSDTDQKNVSKILTIKSTTDIPSFVNEYDKCIETHIQCGIIYHRCILCFKPAHYFATFNPYCSQCIINFETYNVPLYCRADDNCVKRKKHNPTQCVLCNRQYEIRHCQLCGYNLNDLDLYVAYHWTISPEKNDSSFIQPVRICKLCCDDKHFSLDPLLTIITNE